MGVTSYFLILILVAILLAIIIELINKGNIQIGKLPYFKKQNFLSFAEISFFKVLEQATGNKYYIFPQVNLASLVRPNAKGKNWWKYFGKISQKSVDYVLADKRTCNPILVLELGDSSHIAVDRRVRDSFVDNVLDAAGLPILHINFKNGYSVTQLQKDISDRLDKTEIKKVD